MNVVGRFCEYCGQDLLCRACNGTGISVKCCGELRSGRFCNSCGKDLSNLLSQNEKCPICYGLGKTRHICPRK